MVKPQYLLVERNRKDYFPTSTENCKIVTWQLQMASWVTFFVQHMKFFLKVKWVTQFWQICHFFMFNSRPMCDELSNFSIRDQFPDFSARCNRRVVVLCYITKQIQAAWYVLAFWSASISTFWTMQIWGFVGLFHPVRANPDRSPGN